MKLMKPSERKVWAALWESDEGLTFTKLQEITKLSPRGLTLALKSSIFKELIAHDPIKKVYNIKEPKDRALLELIKPTNGAPAEEWFPKTFKYETAYNYILGQKIYNLKDDNIRKEGLFDLLKYSLRHLELLHSWYVGNMIEAVKRFVKLNELTKREFDEELEEAIRESTESGEKAINKHMKEMFTPVLQSTLNYMYWNWDLIEDLEKEYERIKDNP